MKKAGAIYRVIYNPLIGDAFEGVEAKGIRKIADT